MAIISANVQYKRGEHLLLDESSLQRKYSSALLWAQDPYSNAAVGQYIYLEEAETIDDVVYAKGPYIVEAIGENAILTPLSKTIAGEQDLGNIVSNLQTDVVSIKTDIQTIKDDISVYDTSITEIIATLDTKVDSTLVYTKSEVDDAILAAITQIPDSSIKNVSIDDKILSLDNDGILSSTLTFSKETIDDVDYLIIKGKNGSEIGKVSTAEFTVDGMIEDVKFSTTPGKENCLVLTFNTAAGKQDIEVDFSKYVDAYKAGEGLTLANNTFSVDFTKVEKIGAALEVKSEITKDLNNKVDKVDGASLVSDDLIAKLEGLKDIKSVGENLSVSIDGELNVDLSNYVVKDGNKVLSSNDFTNALKEKLDGIAIGAEVNVVKSVNKNGILTLDENGVLGTDLSIINDNLSAKLDASAKINNVSFVDGIATINAGDIALKAAITRGDDEEEVYAQESSIQSVLSDLSQRIDVLDPNISGKFPITSITAGNGINVQTSDGHSTIAVKLSETEGNKIEIKTDGVYVPDMKSYWETITK